MTFSKSSPRRGGTVWSETEDVLTVEGVFVGDGRFGDEADVADVEVAVEVDWMRGKGKGDA